MFDDHDCSEDGAPVPDSVEDVDEGGVKVCGADDRYGDQAGRVVSNGVCEPRATRYSHGFRDDRVDVARDTS